MHHPAPQPCQESSTKLLPLPQLAGIPLPARSWESPLAVALYNVFKRPPKDMHHFPYVLAYFAAHGTWLGEQQTTRLPGNAAVREEHKLARAFTKQLGRHGNSRLATTLKALLLELQLRGGNEELIRKLASSVRGLTIAERSPLVANLWDPDGLNALCDQVDYVLSSREGTDRIGGFKHLWMGGLVGFVTELRLESRARWDDSDGSDSEVGGSERLDDLLVLDPARSHEQDSDHAFVLTPPVEPGRAIPSLPMRVATARGMAVYRSSECVLVREPDSLLPGSVLTEQWESARSAAELALKRGEVLGLQRALAALLVMEVGLTGQEMHTATFSSRAHKGALAVDWVSGAVRRAEQRPPQAADPGRVTGNLWRPTGGDILFPMSPIATQVACAIGGALSNGNSVPVFAGLKLGPNAVLNMLTAASPVPASVYRFRIAAHVSEALGSDAAQIAFGESFGAPVTATYYAAFPVQTLTEMIGAANPGLGPGTVNPPTRWGKDYVGSRVRPLAKPMASAWAQFGCLRRRGRGRPSCRAIIQELPSKRDALALHFMFATGHRPVASLSEVTLDDLLPAHGMAVIADKRSDAAHLTRLVCTGQRFWEALESYLGELETLVRLDKKALASQLAAKVLSGTAPLFSVVQADRIEALDVSRLIDRLPTEWAMAPNVHRHLLCQGLIERGAAPELRNAQMGWLDGPFTAFSDESPYAPTSLGQKLGLMIDEWLVYEGWLGGDEHGSGARKRILAYRDWMAIRANHHTMARSIQKRARANWQKRTAEAKPGICQRLLSIGGSLLVNSGLELRLAGESLVLCRDPNASRQVTSIEKELVLDWLRPFRGNGPIDYVTAVRMLDSALSAAARRGVVKTWLPPIPVWTQSRAVSPFVKGLGRAALEADLLRCRLREALRDHSAETEVERVETLIVIALWFVAAETCHRALGDAVRIVSQCDQAEHSMGQDWVLRIPFGAGHVALTGPAAIVIQRLRHSHGWQEIAPRILDRPYHWCGRLIVRLIPEIYQDVPPEEAAKQVECVIQLLGAAELEGAARLIMNRAVITATVTAQRAASVIDGVTVPRHMASQKEPRQQQESSDSTEDVSAGPVNLSSLMKMFDPRYDGMIDGSRALPARKRKKQLRPLVVARLQEMGEVSSVERMFLEYTLRLLDDGGPRSAGGMRVSSIYKIYHQLLPAIVTLGLRTDMTHVDAERLFVAVSAGISRRSQCTQLDAIRALRAFVDASSRSHPIPELDWGSIYRSGGHSMSGEDPALLTDDEVGHVIAQLRADADMRDISSIERRRREVTWVAGVLMEASGARPASIYGLTLGDIYIGMSTSYLHLRDTGHFGSIKTSASAGFVPLCGKSWRMYQERISAWLSAVGEDRGRMDLRHIPLLQKFGSPGGMRYSQNEVFKRIGELVRWVAQASSGRSYWLRKRRIWLRHNALRRRDGSSVRQVGYVLRHSGHRNMTTPLASYMGENRCFTERASSSEQREDYSDTACLAGITSAALAMRQRRRARNERVSLDHDERVRSACCLALAPPQWNTASLSSAPVVHPIASDVSPIDVEKCMQLVIDGVDVRTVANRLALSMQEVEAVSAMVRQLELRLQSRRDHKVLSTFRTRRSTAFSAQVAGLIECSNAGLLIIANDWISLARSRKRTELRLADPKAVAELHKLCAQLDLVATQEERALTYKVRSAAAGSRYGSWTALRWALVVAWVVDRTLAALEKRECP